jgi:AbrB family looped-hinge helix DNA binding protein
MNLKRVLSRRDVKRDREYFRYDITIPKEVVEELKWSKGTELAFEVKGKKLEIRKK